MFPRSLVAGLLLSFSCAVVAQELHPPATFRLVMPHGPGAILIDTTGGWKLDRLYMIANGKRPIALLSSPSPGVYASYMLEFDPPYYNTSEDCKNDSLGGVLHETLAKAKLADKRNDTRLLKNGQTLAIGSYLIKENEGLKDQQNVWGFFAKDHTCATIHLSKVPFHPDEAHVFDALLDNFSYDPNYVPTEADYATMAKLMPPDMAALYFAPAVPVGAANQPSKIGSAEPSQSLTFAFASHPGYLHIDAPNFAITELSAKPNGNEFGIRAKDNSFSHAEVLGFLFHTVPAQPTAKACRDWMMAMEKQEGDGYSKKLSVYNVNKHEMKSESGVDIAIVDYQQSKDPSPYQFVRRAFVAHDDLCADIKISASNALTLEAEKILLDTLKFDPDRQPDFFAKFRYATVLYDHQAYAAAAPAFEDALSLVSTVEDPLKWRRVATDQASMSYGMAGDLKRSRAVNEAAIAKDPDYPLYYYNLACADAESGNATEAKLHLQQAFDRRANTIKGETLPDPTKDDSILKLKKDEAFWTFVQSLPKS